MLLSCHQIDSTTTIFFENHLKSLRVDGGETRFILYNNGNDGLYTKIISAVCGNLIAQGPVAVPVRAQEPVEVYLNGEYWGLYTRREVIEDAIARFEGLADTAGLKVAAANRKAVCGDVTGLKEAFRSIQELNLSLEEDRQTLEELLVTESFLNWLAVNAYFGTADLYGEIYFYQIGEGPWKCAAGDFAYAWITASDNSLGQVANQDEAQPLLSKTIPLAGKMLKASEYRDAFLTKLGAALRGACSFRVAYEYLQRCFEQARKETFCFTATADAAKSGRSLSPSLYASCL